MLATITFVFGIAAVLMSLVLLGSSLRGDLSRFRLLPIDVVYGITVAWILLSFLLVSRRSQLLSQVYSVAMVFVGYILVRLLYPVFFEKKLALFAGLVGTVVGLEALRGLIQLVVRAPLKGSFIHVNHMAMFIALNIPIVLGLIWYYQERPQLRRVFILISGLAFLVVILTKCRSAYIGLALTLPIMLYMRKRKYFQNVLHGRSKAFRTRLIFALGTASLMFVSMIYLLKPISAVGRLVAWRISFLILKDHPFLGVGFDNFGSYFPLYQGNFFASGLGSDLERLSASFLPTAMNDYIENLVELGLLGFMVFVVFWLLVWIYIHKSMATSSGSRKALVFGYSGAVMVYMIMSFFYYPQRILPIFGLFIAYLAFLVSESQAVRPIFSTRVTRWWCLKRIYLTVFSICALLGSSLLMPPLYREFRGEMQWKNAQILAKQGKTEEAYALYQKAYPSHKGYGDYLDDYGRYLLERGELDGAVAVLENGKYLWPSPFLIENLAKAYKGKEEWNKAIVNARLADDILPWRLATKFLLAETYPRVDDIYRGLKYAELVINTPMKIPSQRGEQLKARAQILREDLNQKWQEKESLFRTLMDSKPEHESRELRELLDKAGDNRGQCLQAYLEAVPEERGALFFLLKHMPEKDLHTLSAKLLSVNLGYAFKVRSGIVPGEIIPENIFLNYVLPYAQLHENRDNWRPDFYKRFLPLVQEASTVEEAVMTLNEKIFEMFGVGFENRRLKDGLLSPFEIIDHGAESCAGLSVFLADACRSVGIPARVVILPRWKHIRGGHLWVEVYDHGIWKYLGAFDRSPLNATWFTQLLSETDASRPEHRIYAASFQRTGLQFPQYRDVHFIDVTDNYVDWPAHLPENKEVSNIY